MKIHYLNCDNKAKLFSFHRHDYKVLDIDRKHYMIDGGFYYTRCSTDGTIEHDEIKNLIKDIREGFTWTQNYNENNERIEPKTALLKDLTSSHICGILSYFTNDLSKKFQFDEALPIDKSWFIIHEIFIQELDYRIKSQII